jgi:hypothetical protein
LVDPADTAAEELCVIAASVTLGRREVATTTLFCATKMIIIND